MKRMSRIFPLYLFLILLCTIQVRAESPEEAQARKAAYINAIRTFADQRTFPDGMKVGDVLEESVFRENSFAVCDVDEDGVPELLFRYENGFMAELAERIFDYDSASGSLREEVFMAPFTTYYTGGIIQENASHNHSLDYEFWPYQLLRYDAASDAYSMGASVTGWRRDDYPSDYNNNPFPSEYDKDGDGEVFTITLANGKSTTCDADVLNSWRDRIMANSTEMQIPWKTLDQASVEAYASSGFLSTDGVSFPVDNTTSGSPAASGGWDVIFDPSGSSGNTGASVTAAPPTGVTDPATAAASGNAGTAYAGTLPLTLMSSDVSDYPNVRLYFSCNDASGQSVVIQSPTANIRETVSGGQEIERTVRSVEQLSGNQGLSIDVVVDKSGSMSDSFGQMQTIMSQFINSLDYASGDRAEIISFDSYIMYMCTYTNNVSLLNNGVYNMTPYGDTALYDALLTGINNAANQAGARCVIGFTDGQDNRSTHSYQEVISVALQKEVPVYLIGFGDVDSYTLDSICRQTGGMYWDVNSLGDVSTVMQQIYSLQKNLICVEYESDTAASAYTTRTVTCTITDSWWSGVVNNTVFTPVEAVKAQPHASRYEIFQADVSWEEANNLCIQRGGHLATITSPEEQQQLSTMAQAAGLKYIWIGGYTSVRNGVAYGHWITGEPFAYTAWFPGEPSRNDRDGTPEFYLMLWYVQNYWSWNDQRNDVIRDTNLTYFIGKTGYICEYEY